MTTLVITFRYFGVESYVDKIYWDLINNKLITVIRWYKNGRIDFLNEKGEVCS